MGNWRRRRRIEFGEFPPLPHYNTRGSRASPALQTTEKGVGGEGAGKNVLIRGGGGGEGGDEACFAPILKAILLFPSASGDGGGTDGWQRKE